MHSWYSVCMEKLTEIIRLRVDADLLKRATKQAKQEGRTMSSLFRYATRLYILMKAVEPPAIGKKEPRP